eukprot:1156284-Pelagomonas_calceolata.AAC.9
MVQGVSQRSPWSLLLLQRQLLLVLSTALRVLSMVYWVCQLDVTLTLSALAVPILATIQNFVPVSRGVFPDLFLDVSHLGGPQVKGCFGGLAGHGRELQEHSGSHEGAAEAQQS